MSSADYEERLKTGRNDSCPCGSGKKYKKCHRAEDETARSAALKALEEEAKARAAAKAEEEEGEASDDEAAKPKMTTKGKVAKKSGSKSRGRAGNQAQIQSDTKPKNMPRRGGI